MRWLALPLLVAVLSSCLSGAMRLNTDRRVRSAAESPQSCNFYVQGEEDHSRLGMWDLTGMISAPVLDVGVIYYLSLSNPWYGFGYFALGYPMVAAERVPPWGFGRWCGTPEAPQQPPFEYYYMLESASDTCELTEERERFLDFTFLHFNEIAVHWSQIENAESVPPLPMEMKRLSVPAEKGLCVYAYYMPGGEEAFKKEMVAQKKEPNEE
ncbi:hypothetical protein [Leptonema illini]|uniref:Lipoprotein n=1 Tax=Leptonema illini DSM 21528 TaxID=929563 RepID=H2CI42_9LEPT|nr:hypothetical protein [Leptonema illini]EHQ08065.1 hypothetical protein Lepil_3407 [Leptonema illini DSM 21528]